MLAHTVLVYMARITQLTDLVVFSSTSCLELFAHNMYLFPSECMCAKAVPSPRFNSRWRPNYSKKFLKTRLTLSAFYPDWSNPFPLSVCAIMHDEQIKGFFRCARCSRRFCKSSQSGPGAPQSNWNHGNKSIVGACNCSAGDKLDCYLGCSARVSAKPTERAFYCRLHSQTHPSSFVHLRELCNQKCRRIDATHFNKLSSERVFVELWQHKPTSFFVSQNGHCENLRHVMIQKAIGVLFALQGLLLWLKMASKKLGN